MKIMKRHTDIPINHSGHRKLLKILKSGKLIRGTRADGAALSKAIFGHICSEKDA